MACPQGIVFERSVVVTTRADGQPALAQALDEEARQQCAAGNGDLLCRPVHMQILDYSESIQNFDGIVRWPDVKTCVRGAVSGTSRPGYEYHISVLEARCQSGAEMFSVSTFGVRRAASVRGFSSGA